MLQTLLESESRSHRAGEEEEETSEQSDGEEAEEDNPSSDPEDDDDDDEEENDGSLAAKEADSGSMDDNLDSSAELSSQHPGEPAVEAAGTRRRQAINSTPSASEFL